MRRYFIYPLIVFLYVTVSQTYAQDTKAEKPKYGWQKVMVGNLNLTQTTFDNWVQGGENTFTWQLSVNFKFVNDQEKYNWANAGKFAYGSSKIGDQGSRKSTDEIKLESVYTRKLGIFVNPYVGATGETQFAAGYNYTTDPKIQISAFFDPAYFRESLGIGYSRGELIKTRLGVAFKQTITSDYPIPYADDPETTDKVEKTKSEIGAESVSDLSWKVAENSLLTSKLELFSNLNAFNEIDVNWDNIFSTKISKYFNINFNFKLLYDRDISKKRQIKQAFAFGITYTFI